MGTKAGPVLSTATQGTMWAYVQNWIARGITFVVVFALARLLSPDEFGAFALTMVFLSVGEIFVEHLFAHAVVQREDLTPEHLNAAFWTTLGCGVALGVLTLVCASFFAQKFNAPNIEPLIMAISPVFIFMAISSIPAALLRRSLDYRTLAQRTALSNLISGAVAIAAAVAGWGVWAFVLQVLCFNAVGTVILWRRSIWRPTCQFSKPALKELMGFSVRITLVKLLDLAETRLVELIVGRYVGLAALGNYSFATRMQQAASQLLAAPLWESSVSVFSRHQSNPQALSKALEQRSVLAATFVVPAFLFAAAAGQALIPAVFGEKWLNAVLPFQILCVLGAVRAVAFLYGCLLQGIGEANATVYVAGVRSALGLGLMAFLLQYGASGVAAALLLGQLLSMPFTFRVMRQKTGLTAATLLSQWVVPWLSGGVASCAGWWLVQMMNGHMPYAMVAALSVSLSCTVFLLLMGFFMPKTLLQYAHRLPGLPGRCLRAWLQRMAHWQTQCHVFCMMRLMNWAAPVQAASAVKNGVCVLGSGLAEIGNPASLEGWRSLLAHLGVKKATLLSSHAPQPGGPQSVAFELLPGWASMLHAAALAKVLAQAQALVLLDENISSSDALLRARVIAFCIDRKIAVLQSGVHFKPAPHALMLQAPDAAAWLAPAVNGSLQAQVAHWLSTTQNPTVGHRLGWHVGAPASLQASTEVIENWVRQQSTKVIVFLLPDEATSQAAASWHAQLSDEVQGQVLLLNVALSHVGEIAQCFSHLDMVKVDSFCLMQIALSQSIPILVDADEQGHRAAHLKAWGLQESHLLTSADASNAAVLDQRLQQQLSQSHETRIALRLACQATKDALAAAMLTTLQPRNGS